VFSVGSTLYALIADGMGGHEGGEIAAEEAVSAAERHLLQRHGDLEELTFDAVMEADRAVRNAALRTPRGDMGTTLIVAAIRDNQIVTAHVGDCRAYLYRDGKVSQLTCDHTPEPEVHSSGQLTQALGHGDVIRPEVVATAMPPGSRLLLCSDGIYKADEVAAIRAVGSASSIAEAITCLGNAMEVAGLVDNSTAIVVDCGSGIGWSGGGIVRPPRQPSRPQGESGPRPLGQKGGTIMFLFGAAIAAVLAVAIAERAGTPCYPFRGDKPRLNQGEQVLMSDGKQRNRMKPDDVHFGTYSSMFVVVESLAGYVPLTVLSKGPKDELEFEPKPIRLTERKLRACIGVSDEPIGLAAVTEARSQLLPSLLGSAGTTRYSPLSLAAPRTVVLLRRRSRRTEA
jgi:serine/threonine protein phosphatase PrpC